MDVPGVGFSGLVVIAKFQILETVLSESLSP